MRKDGTKKMLALDGSAVMFPHDRNFRSKGIDAAHCRDSWAALGGRSPGASEEDRPDHDVSEHGSDGNPHDDPALVRRSKYSCSLS